MPENPAGEIYAPAADSVVAGVSAGIAGRWSRRLPARLGRNVPGGAHLYAATDDKPDRIDVILTRYYLEDIMETTSVTSKGQVTIPKPLRQRMGIRQGSKVEFALVGDHVELRVVSTPAEVPASGFGMLKSRRTAVPTDFDPAGLLKKTAPRGAR